MRIWLVGVLLTLGTIFGDPPPTPPSYDKEIDPMMRRYCAGCHGKRMPRGSVSVVTYEALIKSKKGKVLIVPGKPDDSVLLKTMEGHKPIMPPKDAPLQPTKAEIARVRAWIAAGAKDDSE